jgi:hypothetical protein
LLYFSNVLYLHFFVDWWDVYMWTGNLRTLFCLTKRWQIQIIYQFTWKYIICLRCVCLKLADCFLSSPSLNICFFFVIKLSKEKAYFMYGWTWEMEHKMYYLLLTWVSVWDSAPYFHSSVSNVNFVLWKGGAGVQKYFLYAQMTIQCVECAITEIYLLLVARNL